MGMPYLKNPIAGVELPGGSQWRDRRLDEAEAQRFQRTLAQQSNELVKLVMTFECQRRLNFDPPWTGNAEVKLTHPGACY